ncbi:MAG: hypothetical protein KJO98_00975 [Rhodothermia bacterium]|nr:hypothetical protein [Rhodothermia bacterium]
MAEWHASTEALATGVVRYGIAEDERPLSFSDVVDRWQTKAFAGWFNKLLASFQHSAFFWECRPVSMSDADEPFEFVLLRARALDSVSAESGAFREHFERAGESTVLVFPNLGRDATLVVPTPAGPQHSYAHLAAFTRNAPNHQQVALWNTVGRQAAGSITEAPLWLSTCGLGVYWLHVRLDSWPKYYQFREYRNVIRQP